MNCWPGCIARVVEGCPQNAGVWMLCLEVLQKESQRRGTPVWHVQLLSSARGKRRDGRIVWDPPGHEGYMADKWLRPIPPDELHDSTLTEEPLHATA